MGSVNGNRVQNPLYENKKEMPQPDRNAEPEPRRLALGGVTVRRANPVRGGLSPQTMRDVEQALYKDICELYDVEEENAVAKLVASTLSEGLKLPLGKIYGVVTETPRGQLLERVGLRKNRGLGRKEDYHRRLFKESQERRSLGRLVSNIGSGDNLEALQAVLRDRARRTTIRETAASIEIDCLAELSFLTSAQVRGFPTSAQVRGAILAGLELAFPEASEGKRQEQLQAIARKAGWDMRAAGAPDIYVVRQLQLAFHRLIREDVDIKVILGQFHGFKRFGVPALIVDKVLAGLGEQLGSKLPLQAGDLEDNERKALKEALKDSDFMKPIREQVVTDVIMRHVSGFNDHPTLVVENVLAELSLPPQAGTLEREELKTLAKNLEDPKFTAAMQRQVKAELRSFDAQVEAVVNEDIENLI